MSELHSEGNFNVSLYKNNKENLLSEESLLSYLKTDTKKVQTC